MSGTPERILTAKGARLAARDWLAAMAAHEAHRLEVNRLWLEYLQLADPVGAPKIRRLLKYDKKDAGMTADELFREAAVPLGRPIPRPQELRHAPSRNHPRPASTPLCGGADQNRHLSDALKVPYC
jgi:hypothetical protein